MVHFVKHSVLPLIAASNTMLACIRDLESVSVVSVLDEELEMIVGPHVDNDWGVVGDIVMQIFKILFCIAKFSDLIQNLGLIFEVDRL